MARATRPWSSASLLAPALASQASYFSGVGGRNKRRNDLVDVTIKLLGWIGGFKHAGFHTVPPVMPHELSSRFTSVFLKRPLETDAFEKKKARGDLIHHSVEKEVVGEGRS